MQFVKALKCVTVLSQYWSVNCWSLLTLLIHICSNWSSLDLVGFPQAFSIFLIQEVWNISSLSFHYGVFFFTFRLLTFAIVQAGGVLKQLSALVLV